MPNQQQEQNDLPSSPWLGLSLVEAFSVGKEVFLIFSNEKALRLHFGMNGSLALSPDGKPIHRPYGKRQTPSLQMKFKSPDGSQCFQMECHSTTMSEVSANVARSKLERLQHLDACALEATFDAEQVLVALRKRPHAMICDAVLDQNRFPGVGNIVKIEGLHHAEVNPKRLVKTLSEADLRSVIYHCRQYAMRWLKAGRAPNKRVYNETTCKTCNTFGSVRMVKLGNDLSRVTFWCDQCQPLRSTASSNQPPLSLQRTNNQLSNSNSRTTQPAHTLACPQHGARSFCIRRVRHKEHNKNRLFGTCKTKGCPYFAWADTHFPSCNKCRKKTILRVSKKEHSGGRWFLSCSSCSGTFAWATPQQLAPLGKFLTPLL